MAGWLLTGSALGQILEPSAGEGAFLRALASEAARLGCDSPAVLAVEIDKQTFDDAFQAGVYNVKAAINKDFLAVRRSPVDAVIGNPPFVRLRNLPNDQRDRALRIAKDVLGEAMQPSGSLWMPFVLHASTFLQERGRMAMVLPAEATHVKYARSLWKFLAKTFNSLRIVQVHERVFPDIMQDVVLLFADGYGSSTDTVLFEWYESVNDLREGTTAGSAVLSVPALVNGSRAFQHSRLGEDYLRVDKLIRERATPKVLSEVLRLRIGYVSGNRDFFHPSDATASNFAIPATSLRPALASARQLRGSGLRTQHITDVSHLYRPPIGQLSDGDRSYVRSGERDSVHLTYKCRNRSPWYRVPLDTPPDVFFSVFGNLPRMVINDAGLLVSNSFVAGHLTDLGWSPELLSAAWYNSFTRLQVELEVHSLGGGVLVVIPGELGKIQLPTIPPSYDLGYLSHIDQLLASGLVDQAYELGDRVILGEILSLTRDEIGLVQDEVQLAVRRRLKTTSNSSRQALGSVGTYKFPQVGRLKTSQL